MASSLYPTLVCGDQENVAFKVQPCNVNFSSQTAPYLLLSSSFFVKKNHSKDSIARVSIMGPLDSLPTFLQYIQ